MLAAKAIPLPSESAPQTTRQPLLWAALAYGAGIIAGNYAWRPPLWWVIAILAFLAASAYFVRRRLWLAFPLALGALFWTGALAIQMRNVQAVGDDGALAFAGDEDATVTAHVIRGGQIREAGFGGLRQSLDVETDEITTAAGRRLLRTGMRLGIYGKHADAQYGSDESHVPMHAFVYGERLRFVAKLRAPRNFRNPGAFDYRGYLADRGIVILASTKITLVERLPGFVGSRLEQRRERIQRSIVEKIQQLWAVEDAALMSAAVVGESAFLTSETKTDFQRSGTYHILVVSGMNVSILACVVFWLVRRMRAGDLMASAATVGTCAAYAFVTDVGPPAWRAVLMLTIYLGVRFVYRERSMLNALGAAALGVLAADPKALLGPSFQLTFLAVLIIAAIAIPLLERTSQPYLRGLRHLDAPDFDRTLPPRVAQMRLDLRMIAGRLAWSVGKKYSLSIMSAAVRGFLSGCEILFVSALMQVALALPMAYYFHRATVLGIVANSLAVPLTGILMPAAALAVALGYVVLPVAKGPAMLAAWALHGITSSVRGLGGLRIADHRIAMPEAGTIVFACGALAVAMLLAQRRRVLAAGGLMVLTASAMWVSIFVPHPHIRPGMIELTAMDVGQGDALLVVSPEGKTLLVDAGGPIGGQQSEFDFGENVVSPYLWERRISRLDVVALTHAHSDHLMGMHAVLNNFHPKEMWIGALPDTPAVHSLLNYAKSLYIRIVPRSENESFEFGGMQVSVLSPPAAWRTSTQPKNNDSLVLRLTYRNSSVLLEGDAESAVEQRMASMHALKSDLLKVGHHGSATSSSSEFLGAVQPRWAVISVGARNTFGHPRTETLQRLQDDRIATYRTDRNGAITFYLDGDSVSPQLACLR